MFIVVKLNKYKIFMSISILIIILILIGFGYGIITNRDINCEDFNNTLNPKESVGVIKFIENFGWKIEKEPVSVEEFYLPKEYNILYRRYNEYQKDINKDLTKYKGKKVKRYTYKVLNYQLPQEYKNQQVYADVIVYNGKPIGGNLKTNELNGFMVSLRNRTFKEITGVEEWEYK